MKRFFSLMVAVIAVCGLFSSCESYDAGELKKTDILGTWYEGDDEYASRYVFNKDGSFDEYYFKYETSGYYGYYKEYHVSGTFAIDREARTWVEHRSSGYSYAYKIILLSDTTFAFEDVGGDVTIWKRSKQ